MFLVFGFVVVVVLFCFLYSPSFVLLEKKNQSQSGHELVALDKWQDEKGTILPRQLDPVFRSMRVTSSKEALSQGLS